MSCSCRLVLSVLFWLSCSGCPGCLTLTVLCCHPILASCSGSPILEVLPLFFLSRSGCPVLLFSNPTVLSWQPCPDSSFQAVLSWQSCSACPVLLVLSCQSSVLPVLFRCPVHSILFRLSCSVWTVLPVPFWMSHSACPALPVLF
jgi:hypothetical protein